ncbi:MAG: hypothetical protein AAB625_02265 [Patescibacteria group bacterium]
MSPDFDKRQEEVTSDYKKANLLNTKGLPDLDRIKTNELNQTTRDYLKAA